jgi:hypothetical protein
MSIVLKKSIFNYDDDIKDILQQIRFKNEPIKMIGSFTIEHIKYFSDYDIENKITKNLF